MSVDTFVKSSTHVNNNLVMLNNTAIIQSNNKALTPFEDEPIFLMFKGRVSRFGACLEIKILLFSSYQCYCFKNLTQM